MNFFLNAVRFILLLGLDFTDCPEVPKAIRILCKAVIWTVGVLWVIACLLSLCAAVIHLQRGQFRAGILCTAAALLLGGGFYAFILRYYIQKRKK